MIEARTRLRAAGCAAAIVVFLPLAAPSPCGAQADARAEAARDRLVVTTEWLATRLADPDLVLLHVGTEEEYRSEHIPGGRHITLEAISAPEDHEGGHALSLQMPAPADLERTLEGLGIGDGSRVVVYYGSDWVTPAARVLYTLDWIGLGERASLLDGGMQQWKREGRPVTAELPRVEPGRLTARPRPDLVVTAAWVHEHLDDPRYRIIDARAPVHYDGIQPSYLHRKPVRKGHIPGAANVPMNLIVDDDLRIRPAEELRRLFRDAGVEPGQTVVGYCHLGQFATLMLFGARTLGHPVTLYDGSFQEWGNLEHLPVELPGEAR